MKRFIALLIIAVTMSANSTNAQYQHLAHINGKEVFVCVYDIEGLSENEIEKLLTSSIPRIPGFVDFYKSEGIITGKIEKAQLDLDQYGCRWGNTSAMVHNPFFANVVIEWKEGRYRVTMSNMEFRHRSLGSFRDPFSKKDRFLTSKTILRTGACFEQYFRDLFTLKNAPDAW